MLWLGIGEAQKVAIVFMGSWIYILLATIEATKRVDPLLIRAARNLGASDLHDHARGDPARRAARDPRRAQGHARHRLVVRALGRDDRGAERPRRADLAGQGLGQPRAGARRHDLHFARPCCWPTSSPTCSSACCCPGNGTGEADGRYAWNPSSQRARHQGVHDPARTRRGRGRATCRSRSTKASSSACSAPLAAASRRCSTCSRASCSRPPARSCCAAGRSSHIEPRCGMVFQSYALFPVEDGARQCRVRSEDAGPAGARSAAERAAAFIDMVKLTASRITIRPSCRAACSSASRSRGCSPPIRRCC